MYGSYGTQTRATRHGYDLSVGDFITFDSKIGNDYTVFTGEILQVRDYGYQLLVGVENHPQASEAGTLIIHVDQIFKA